MEDVTVRASFYVLIFEATTEAAVAVEKLFIIKKFYDGRLGKKGGLFILSPFYIFEPSYCVKRRLS